MRSLFAAVRMMLMLVRLTYRFWTGRPLSGERKTDATFTRPATRSLDPSGTALRWEMMRGASRLAYRVSGLYALTLTLTLLMLKGVSAVLTVPWYLRPGSIVLTHLAVGGLLLAAYVTVRGNIDHGMRLPMLSHVLNPETGEQKWELQWEVRPGRLQWEKLKVIPVAQAVAPQLQMSASSPKRARELVSIPRDYRENGGIIVRLPAHFTGVDANGKKRLVGTVKERLGMREELSASWVLTGDSPHVVLNMPEAPPTMVSFTDMLPYFDAAAEYEFVYGRIAGGEAFSVHLANDTPHDALSAGSGGGKSELLKSRIMQALHRGWYVIIFDWKEESQAWAKGLPGVKYVSDIEGMHDLAVSLGEEVEFRKSHPDVPRVPTYVVNEEWGISAPLLKEYWDILRATSDAEERKSMPLRSPAVSAMMKIVFTGRSLLLFQTLVAQRFSARVTNGNADLRESFGVIHMTRWKAQTVKMLAPDIKPFPKKITQPGRWVAVMGDEAVIYQAALITDEEAREYALSGVPAPVTPFNRSLSSAPAQRDATMVTGSNTLRDQLSPDATGRSESLPYMDEAVLASEVRVQARKLSDMADALAPLGITHNILRNAARDDSKGDPSFPPAYGGSPTKGYTYDLAEVTNWARRRYASQRAEKEINA